MELENLSELIDQCRDEYEKLEYKSDIQLNTALKQLLLDGLQSVDSSSTHKIHPFSIEFITRENLTTSVPSSGLWYGHIYWKLVRALNVYCKLLSGFKKTLNEEFDYKAQKAFMKTLPSDDALNDTSDPVARRFLELMDQNISDSTDLLYFKTFCSDKTWWFKSAREDHEASSGKTLDRGDVKESSLMLACGVVVANSAKLCKIVDAFEKSEELRSYFSTHGFEKFGFSDQMTGSMETSPAGPAGENVIYYGAPGTGKSYRIDDWCTTDNSIRTVFHEDLQYGDFVGSLKPGMNDGNIEYAFRPGPFCQALALAERAHDVSVYLVIEEINRAAAAAVFGDVFQLLDRRPDGRSKYGISVTDNDMLDYLRVNAPSTLDGNRLHIPANLSLFATMNSSDQSVMPLDTAFRRRWRFEYLPVDFSRLNMTGISQIPVSFSDGTVSLVSWKSFALAANTVLSARSIPEDRLLGPWFLSGPDIENKEAFRQSLKNKVLLYLWSDVLRHYDKSVVFSNVLKTFGELVAAFDENKPVFSADMESAIRTRLTEVP